MKTKMRLELWWGYFPKCFTGFIVLLNYKMFKNTPVMFFCLFLFGNHFLTKLRISVETPVCKYVYKLSTITLGFSAFVMGGLDPKEVWPGMVWGTSIDWV